MNMVDYYSVEITSRFYKTDLKTVMVTWCMDWNIVQYAVVNKTEKSVSVA